MSDLFGEDPFAEEPMLEEAESAPAGDANNRTFLIVAGILGGLVLLTILCMAIYALVVLPKQKQTQVALEATRIAQNTQVAQALTGTAIVQNQALTPLPSPVPTETPTPTQTPVIAMPTDTPTPTPNFAVTSTIAAALTQAAIAVQTVVPTTTALPQDGFVNPNGIGIPGLALLAALLVAVIFVARRLRSSASG